MAISSVDGISAALPSGQGLLVNRASIANTAANQFFSMWRSGTQPAQGAIPGAVAVCDNTTVGGMSFTNPGGGLFSYLALATLVSPNAGTYVQILDRLSHMAGLSGTVTTAQTAAVDCTVSTSNMVLRKGATNYSDIQWFIEIYTDLGATGVNATCAVVYDDASTANIVIALGATPRASRRYPIISTTAGRFIRSITSVTLSATTGTAGSFGITAARALAPVSMEAANVAKVADWALLGIPRVQDSACLEHMVICPTTTTGTLIGSQTLIQV